MFDDTHLLTLVGTSVLMVVSAAANITVLTRLVRQKKAGKASRLNTLLIHLALADLLVAFLGMPMEIVWSVSDIWHAGDLMCQVMMFVSDTGLYLSSSVVMCMAVDRYYAVLKPLNVTWEARLGYVLSGAWGVAVLASMPESIIFHTETYPDSEDYVQCVSTGGLSGSFRFAYVMVSMSLVYVLPLLVTVYCSCAVLREVIKLSNPANDTMRRSGADVLRRARARTLKMTITIVAVFFICWTPFYSYYIWYYIDKNSIYKINPMVTRILWLFAFTNSCANPIVYGIFNRRRKNNAATSQQSIFLTISSGSHQSIDRGSEAV